MRTRSEEMRDRALTEIAKLTSDKAVQDLALRMNFVSPEMLPAGVATLEQVVKFVEQAPDECLERVELFESIRSAENLNNALGTAQLWFR